MHSTIFIVYFALGNALGWDRAMSNQNLWLHILVCYLEEHQEQYNYSLISQNKWFSQGKNTGFFPGKLYGVVANGKKNTHPGFRAIVKNKCYIMELSFSSYYLFTDTTVNEKKNWQDTESSLNRASSLAVGND